MLQLGRYRGKYGGKQKDNQEVVYLQIANNAGAVSLEMADCRESNRELKTRVLRLPDMQMLDGAPWQKDNRIGCQDHRSVHCRYYGYR